MSICLIATGGTIASHHDGTSWTNLDGHALVAELDRHGVADGHPIDVEVVDVAAGPSSNLSVDDMAAIVGHVRAAIDAGHDGVVVTHGTDTLDLTAFLADLLLGVGPDRPPVVFTGAMRVHSHPDPDGPRNMLDALRVAAHPSARGREVLVCLDGVLHAADRVVKVDAGSLDAFTSAPLGPVGAVVDGVPVFRHDPPRRPAATALEPDVGFVSCVPGLDAADAEHHLHGRRGAVVEGYGDLNLPAALWGPVHRATGAGTLVVVASRAFTATSRSEGLDLLGAVGAGGLTAPKARLAVMAALGSCAGHDEAIAFLHEHRLVRSPDHRSST